MNERLSALCHSQSSEYNVFHRSVFSKSSQSKGISSSRCKKNFSVFKHTPNLRLWYPHDSEFKLVGYTDSDYGGYRINRKSTSGGTQLSGKQSYKLVKQKADVSGLLYC